MNRRMRMEKLQSENEWLLIRVQGLEAALSKTIPPPPKKHFWYVLGTDGSIAGTIDLNTTKRVAQVDADNIMLEVHKTQGGNMIIKQYSYATMQWTTRLPTEKEQKLYANALIDKEKLPEF